jgi:FixJ family two-component response regulator
MVTAADSVLAWPMTKTHPDFTELAALMSADSVVSIVDDDESIREAINDLIRSVGLKTAAFDSAEDFAGSSQRKDTACLILDLRMPGMEGLTLQRHLTAAGSRIPIIFITAHDGDDTRLTALHAGAVGFLPKPFREEELLNAVHVALARRTR